MPESSPIESQKRHILKPAQAAERCFGPSRSGEIRLAKMRLYGGGPVFIKIGRSVFYDIKDLDAFLDANRRQTTSDVACAAA